MLKMWKGLKAGLPSVYWHRWKSTDLHIWIFSIFQEYTLFTQIFSVLQQYSPNYSNIQYLATVQTYLLKYLMFCKSIGCLLTYFTNKIEWNLPFWNIHVSRWTNRRRWSQWRGSMRIRRREQSSSLRGLLRTSLQCGSFSFWVSGFLYLAWGKIQFSGRLWYCHF